MIVFQIRLGRRRGLGMKRRLRVRVIVGIVMKLRHIDVRQIIMAVRQTVHLDAPHVHHTTVLLAPVPPAVHPHLRVAYRLGRRIHFQIPPAVAPQKYHQSVVPANRIPPDGGIFLWTNGNDVLWFLYKSGGQRLCLNLKRVCYEENTVYCFVGVCVWRRGGI